ncbi:Pfmc-2TM Maurer's cleft two transmembrane, putative [Plasmodium sp.]|nr:Pfmc-2TM Maurer's cleft two transmembrane, putative [Plasmodium sp.]
MNPVENRTYKISYHNGLIQFRMLEQINTNTKPYGNNLTKVLLNVKNEKGNKAKDNKKKDNKTVNNKTKVNKTVNNKTKDHNVQIHCLVNLVDNMNITHEKKDEIKTLTLKYIYSDDMKEKNKSINELEKYSKEEECKEHMDNFLIKLRMQNDIKYLERENFWNNVWILAVNILLLISIVVICATPSGGNIELFVVGISIFMIYIYARFFPEIKLDFKELKETCKNYFKKKCK